MKNWMLRLGLVVALVAAAAIPIATASGTSRTPEQVVAAHNAAIEACNANAAAAVYAENAKLFTPNGVVVTGRAALLTVYNGFLKSRADGGLCGLHATVVNRFRSGDTIFVESEVTASFLAQPYYSTDGFIIKHGLIAAEVSTFDGSKLKFK